MLADLQYFLKRMHQATLAELAAYVRADQSAVQGMLHLLIQKGLVRKQEMNACRGKCIKCIEVYEWVK